MPITYREIALIALGYYMADRHLGLAEAAQHASYTGDSEIRLLRKLEEFSKHELEEREKEESDPHYEEKENPWKTGRLKEIKEFYENWKS